MIRGRNDDILVYLLFPFIEQRIDWKYVMLCNILYCSTESFVSDVTVNGIKYRYGRSVSLMSTMLSILIWDIWVFIPFEIKIL